MTAANDPPSDKHPVTPDGRYVVVRGRLWRTSDPSLPPEGRDRLVSDLMAARRDVGSGLRSGDDAAVGEARRRVDVAKRALGERGPPWWDDGAPDLNRRLVRNTGSPTGSRHSVTVFRLRTDRYLACGVAPAARHRSEQNFTFSQSRSHFFRHANGLWHAAQIFVGR